jgi:hypothetical protein
MILGAVGTGKRSVCMYRYVDQLIRWHADDRDRNVGGLVLDVKGDFCQQVRRMLRAARREAHYLEIGLHSSVCCNPLHNDLDPHSASRISGNPQRPWRDILFFADEYHAFATVGEMDPTGDTRVFG